MEQNTDTKRAPVKVGILMLDNFSLMAFSNFVEPFRALNRIAEYQAYDWKFISESGDCVTASNGACIQTDYNLTDQSQVLPDFNVVCVCAVLNASEYGTDLVLNWLRKQATKDLMIGGLSTSTFILAKAGLLDGYNVTTHWEGADSLIESYPTLNVTNSLFEIDQNRFTCAGGSAAMDLALFWIGEGFGAKMAAAIADQFVHGQSREAKAPQKQNLVGRYGVYNKKLLTAISLMENNLEEPLSRQEIAEHTSVTPRQLERLFSRYIRMSPLNFYLQLRLDRARELLRQTAMPISEIAIACGFMNFSHFARSYRGRFDHAPSEERLPQ